MAEAPFALEARALRKEYGPKVAVRELTLSVPKGEVFGFLGPNGAGKTTSMKMLLGLVHPTSGAGQVLGRPLGEPRGRARVGYLPEDSGHRRVREYSKGMRQRLGLAQALLGEPELVFLDEPTSGLDPLGRRLVREVIGELRERGTTVFLNSHLLSEVEVTCDRVAFVKDGRVVRDMRLGVEERELEVEMRLERVSEALVAGLARFGRGAIADGDRVRLRVESEERLPEMTRWLAAQDVGLYHLAARRPSLEEIFLEVIGDVPVAG
jgi:ABC-2 type transport system ATP-binding protein